ncbi:MAG: hypothetical protein HY315_00090, partial [Acidobacteria bacterium]|nr:hypothetical protein [Acidobacteriota bacterium]
LFTLTGSLDSVSYSILQPTTIALTGKAIVPSPGSGVAVDPATGAVTVTGGRSVTFKAPGVAGSAAQGTLVFTIQATFSDGTKSNVVNKNIIVLRDSVPSTPPAGTAVGTPLGGNKPADGFFSSSNPSEALVNIPFTLTAFGRDEDGTVKPADPVIGGGTSGSFITAKWERIVGGSPQLLKQFDPVTEAITSYRSFPVGVTEPSAGTYTYRFTITDVLGIGNSYETSVKVSVPNPGPSIKLAADPPATPVEVETTVTLDASPTTGLGTLQFTWTVKVDGSDLAFTTVSPSKISFKVPISAAGKKITVSLAVKDSENKQNTRSFDINVAALTIKALTLPQIRSIVSKQAKTDSEMLDFYAIQPPDFINYVAVMNPAGESGKSELISIRSLDASGNPLSDFYRSVEIGLGSVPFARSVEKMIPEEALAESALISINALSRLTGMGMIIDASLPRMDAFDLTGKSGTDWVLPYLFRQPREKFGIIALQNTSTEDAEVQPSYSITSGSGNPVGLLGTKFTIKRGGGRIIEIVDYFNLHQLGDPSGYVSFTSTRNVQILGLYGDGSEMFAVPGIRREDFAASLLAPVAFRDNEWETTLTLVNGQATPASVRIQLLNAGTDFPTGLRGREFSLSLRPGANEIALGELVGSGTLVPFTSLRISLAPAAGGVGGSVLLRNKVTNAETLWPLVDATTSRLIYPHVVQGSDWQASFAVSNVGGGAASLKASGVLLVRDGGDTLAKKTVQGNFTIPAGGMVASPELSKFGISFKGEIFGGYLLIEAADPAATVDLVAAGLMFHNNVKGEIDSLSLLPVVK